MATTRTWLTTPVGATPLDDQDTGERWTAGPRLPTEPRPPFRYRGAVALAIVFAAVVGLTFMVAPAFLDVQDPTFGDAPTDDAVTDDPTFDQPSG